MNDAAGRIAILGATGHVARNLIVALGADSSTELLLYARRPDAVRSFLDTWPVSAGCRLAEIAAFGSEPVDAVINCVGYGDPAGVADAGGSVYELTTFFESLVLEYLERRPATRYVAFSSGAVYGTRFSEPAGDETRAVIAVNDIGPSDHYGIAKLAAEGGHRAAADLAITDLRLFGLFSRHIDLSARYFMTDVVDAIRTGRELRTGPGDMWRDYVDPRDLAALVRAVLAADAANDVFDVTSAAPVSKFEMLAFFAKEHGLKYAVDESLVLPAATGAKTNYYSTSTRAERIGYRPRHTALQAVAREAAAILDQDASGAA